MRVRVRRFLAGLAICSLLPALLPLQAVQARPLWDDGGYARRVALPPAPAPPSCQSRPGGQDLLRNLFNPIVQSVQKIMPQSTSADQKFNSPPSVYQPPIPPSHQSSSVRRQETPPLSPPTKTPVSYGNICGSFTVRGPVAGRRQIDTGEGLNVTASSPAVLRPAPLQSTGENATIPAGLKITIAGTKVQFSKTIPDPLNVTKYALTPTSLGDGFAKTRQSYSAEDAARTGLAFSPQPFRTLKDLCPDSYNATTNTYYYDTDRITGKTMKYLARTLTGESDNRVVRAADDSLLRDPGDFLWSDDLFRKNRKPPGQVSPPEVAKPLPVSPIAYNQTRINPQPSGVSNQLTAATATAAVTAAAVGTASVAEKAAGVFKPGPACIVNIVAIPFYRNLLTISGYKGERMSNQVVY